MNIICVGGERAVNILNKICANLNGKIPPCPFFISATPNVPPLLINELIGLLMSVRGKKALRFECVSHPSVGIVVHLKC